MTRRTFRTWFAGGLALCLLLISSENVSSAKPQTGLSAASPRPLSQAARLEGHRAIERVYWSHGKGEEAEKSAEKFETLLPEEILRRKAEDSLRQSCALERLWGRAITSEDLQSEIDRMVRDSQWPEMLEELFDALGRDPRLIAECLARPIVAEREIRPLYAFDAGLHRDVRDRARAALRNAAAADALRAVGDQSHVVEWTLAKDNSEYRRHPEGRDEETPFLNEADWSRLMDRLEREVAGPGGTGDNLLPGAVGILNEDEECFYATGVLDCSPGRIRTVTARWEKVPLDEWWHRVRDEFAVGVEVPEADYRLPHASEMGRSEGGEWFPMNGAGAPSARYHSTAVWTGGRMIVWGGWSGLGNLRSGALYSPATDSWSATCSSTSAPCNCPDARRRHAAVYTGPKMVVWGGYGTQSLNTGGEYNPSTNQWQPTDTSDPDLPQGRYNLAADNMVGAMLIWGGQSANNRLDTGGMYYPSDDLWEAVNTSDPDKPGERSNHTLTFYDRGGYYGGLIWGGNNGYQTLASGGLYQGWEWEPLPTANAPDARQDHISAMTQFRVYIWGGYVEPESWQGDGWIWSTPGETWSAMGGENAPEARANHSGVSNTDLLIVWGGDRGLFKLNTGGIYTDWSDEWMATDTADPDTPSPRTWHEAVMANDKMIVWGGFDGADALGDGALLRFCAQEPSVTTAPTGADLDFCTASGVEITWPADPNVWMDYSEWGTRSYEVLRGGNLLASGGCSGTFPYGTTSCVDDTGNANQNYNYAVRYINSCGLAGDSPTVKLKDAKAGQPYTYQVYCTAEDYERCAHSGNLITWPVDPVDWGDDGYGSRSYRVRRDLAAIGSWIPYGTTSYVDAGATPEVEHVYDVLYQNGCGLKTDCYNDNTTDTIGGAPTGLPDIMVEDEAHCVHSGIRITWPQNPGTWDDGGEGTRYYRVRRSGDPIGDNLPYGTTTYLDTGATPGTTYTYTIRYKNGCGLYADTAGVPGADYDGFEPSGIAAITAEDDDICADTGIRVTWEADPADWGDGGENAAGRTYRVLRGSTCDLADMSTVGPAHAYGTTTHTVTSGDNNAPYCFRVRYTNGCGKEQVSEGFSGVSDAVSAQPAVTDGPSVTDPELCVEGALTVSWNPEPDAWNDNGVLPRKYSVLRDGTAVASDLPYGTASWTDYSAAGGVEYLYKVRYINGCGKGRNTDPAAGKDRPFAPGPLYGVRATDADPCGADGLEIRWSRDPESQDLWGDGGEGVRSYDLLRDGTPILSGIPYGILTHHDTGAVPNTQHIYVVRYRNGCGTSGETAGNQGEDAADLTPCPEVGNTLMASVSGSDAALAWSGVSCADLRNYRVYGATHFDADFPGEWDLLASPSNGAALDPLASPYVAYRVTTMDDCGVESP